MTKFTHQSMLRGRRTSTVALLQLNSDPAILHNFWRACSQACFEHFQLRRYEPIVEKHIHFMFRHSRCLSHARHILMNINKLRGTLSIVYRDFTRYSKVIAHTFRNRNGNHNVRLQLIMLLDPP